MIADELQVGDRFASHNESGGVLESIERIGEHVDVYNFRVSNWHTYFVGHDDWGFSVLAHNADYEVHVTPEGKFRLRNKETGEWVKPESETVNPNAAPREFIQAELDAWKAANPDVQVVAPGKIPKVGQSHPSLPVRKNPGDPTHGILNDRKPLMSGADGGNALEVFQSRIGRLSEDAVTSLKHVEGHAAAEMVSNNLTEAVLHINYKTGPCKFCRNGVSELLGEGQKLWVVFPDGIGYFPNKGWFPQ